jgi:spermidine/putrescine transport system permease protein
VSDPETDLPQNGGRRRRRRDRRGSWTERIVLLGPGLLYTAAFVAVPLVLLLVYSALTAKRFGDVGRPFTTENFAKLGEPVYRSVVFTSVRLALIATLLALLIGYPAAYAISRLSKRWRTIALIAVVLPFWTNFLIRTYAWIVLLNNEGLINKIARSLGLVDAPLTLMNNQPAIVLGLVYAYLPLMILPLYAAIERLDPQLTEAATNLGAGALTRFRTVIFPLTAQGAITGSLFVFIPSLGNFVIPELLGGGKTATLGTLARDQYLKAQNWPFGSTVALIVLAFVIVIVVVQNVLVKRWNT